MEKLILLIVAMFSAFASAQENCGYPVSLTRSGFEDGEQPAFIPLLPSNTPLTLAVDGLVANSTVSTEFIQAFGAFTGPANTGITVNGEAIATTNTRYASNLIRLRPGANTITIVASTMDGGSQTISRSINYNNALPLDIELLPEGANSFAPARVNFALRYQLPPQQTALVRAQIDYNGDGIFEVDAATLPTALGANYGEAGDFAVAIRLSFDDGDPQTPLVLRNAT